MKIGLFCHYENHYRDAQKAIFEQVALVQYAESLGFEEVWVTEQHFNPMNLCSSILVLLAHLAGVTSKIRLGSAAVLLAFHNPIRLAEEIATLDNLCGGRLTLGIAKGGPFPLHHKHFDTPVNESRPRMFEAMELIGKLLYESEVSFQGRYFHCNRVTIYPRPLQPSIPVYVATGDDYGIRFAAENSFGLMGGPPFSLERLKNTIAKYRAINNSGADNLMLARFFYLGKTYDEAVCEAMPFIYQFSQRMKANSAQIVNSRHQKLQLFNRQNICFDEDYLLENSIIGDVATCGDKIKKFQDELNLGTIALKPSSRHLQKNLESLTRYNQEVRNYV